MLAVAPDGAEEQFGRIVLMGRPGHVDEMAGAAVLLAGGLSSYVTGQTLHVDGETAAGGWCHDPGGSGFVLGPPPGSGSVTPAG